MIDVRNDAFFILCCVAAVLLVVSPVVGANGRGNATPAVDVHNREPVTGPLTVTSRLVFSSDPAGAPEQIVWLAGLGTEADESPTALAVSFAETTTILGSLWSLQLQSDQGLIPAALMPKAGTGLLSGTDTVRLATIAPRWGHEYETVLAYDPETGNAAVTVTDITTGESVHARYIVLNASEGPYYPAAGTGYAADAATDETLLPLAQVSSLEVLNSLVPTNVSWHIMQQAADDAAPRKADHIDRRHDTLVRANLPWDQLAGHLRLSIQRVGDSDVQLDVPLRHDDSFQPVRTADLPAGTYEWVLQYVEGDSVWDVDNRMMPVGGVNVQFDNIRVQATTDDAFTVSGHARVTTDGPTTMPFTVRLVGDLTQHMFEYDQATAAGNITTAVVANDLIIMEETVGAGSTGQTTTFAFESLIDVPAAAGQRGPWQLTFAPRLDTAELTVTGPRPTAWFSPVPPQSAQEGFLQNEQNAVTELAPGVTLRYINGRIPDGPVNMYLVTADLTRPEITVDSLLAKDVFLSNAARWARLPVSRMLADAGGLVGTNANFFEIKSTMNPRGVHINSGRLIKSPHNNFNSAVGFTADGRPVFGNWRWFGGIRPLHDDPVVYATAGLNITTGGPNDIVIFRAPWRQSPGYRPMEDGSLRVVELVLRDVVDDDAPSTATAVPAVHDTARYIRGTVDQVRIGQPGVPVEDGMAVVTGYGKGADFLMDNFPVGTTAEMHYAIVGETEWPGLDDWRTIQAAASSNVVIVRNGTYGDGRIFTDQDYMPRMVIATTADQSTLYLLAVDGRSQQSVGLTYKQVADFLLHIGAFHAINLDGGGSATLVFNDAKASTPTVINTPSDGIERPVPDGFVVYYDR